MIKLFVTSVFVFSILSQFSEEVLLNCFGFHVRLSLPAKVFKTSTNNRTEGTIYNYIFTEDTTAVVIQCLSMTEKSARLEGVYKRDTVEIDGYVVYRSFGSESDDNRLWQEDIYRDLNLSVRLRFVRKGDYEVFAKSLENLEIITRAELSKYDE